MMRRLLTRLRRDEAGISFTELMVASILTGIMMIMIMSMVVQTTKITSAAAETRRSNAVASNVANEITSVLRVSTTLARFNNTPASAIYAGSRSSITVFAFADVTNQTTPAPTRVTFTLDSTGKVTEDRCPGTASAGFWTFPTPPAVCAGATSRVLGTGVLLSDTSNQLFTYLDANSNPITIGAGSLTGPQALTVASIVVTVRAKVSLSDSNPAQSDPAFISNTVVLRNLGLDSGS